MYLRSLRFSKVYVSQNYTEDATDSNNPNVNPSSPDANWENYQLRINPTDNWMVSNSPLSHLLLAPTLMHKCKVGAVVSERWLSNGNLEHTHTQISFQTFDVDIFSSSRHICRPHYRWTNPCPRVFLWLSFFRRVSDIGVGANIELITRVMIHSVSRDNWDNLTSPVITIIRHDDQQLSALCHKQITVCKWKDLPQPPENVVS